MGFKKKQTKNNKEDLVTYFRIRLVMASKQAGNVNLRQQSKR